VKIAFALIAHQHPKTVERLIRLILADGHVVAVHYDARAPEADFRTLSDAFAGNDSVRVVREFHVAWGQWSIVAATLRCLDEIADAGWEPDYVHLLSGADYPIRPIGDFAAFLERNAGKQFLECVPSNERRWVRGGMQQERYLYRFHFNWRDQRRLFDLAYNLQKLLGLKRKFVRGIEPHMGSQWWTLTWEMVKRIMVLAREPDILKFFKTTLIPDELFFQTMVAHLTDFRNIAGRNLTLYQFTDYGVPVVYYADHIDYLLRQPFFFARKLSSHSPELHEGLEATWRADAERRPRQFPDDAFGRIGTEYEDYRISHRLGVPGRPVVGLLSNLWAENLGGLTRPYFCVLGTSTAELRVVQRALTQMPELLCHGQLFHPHRSEFAGGANSYAGYDADATEILHVSAPNFLADLILSETERTSGFLLRWGQGWHIHEIMFERPNVRVAALRGDPFLAFIETLKPVHPHLDESLDIQPLFELPAEALVHRFRQFVVAFCAFNKNIDQLMFSYIETKPKGWASYIELGETTSQRSIPLRRSSPRKNADPSETVQNVALLHWRSWMAQLGHSFDIDFQNGGADWSNVLSDLRELEKLRQVAVDRLVECGLSRSALESLKEGSDDPKIVLAFV
jgi:hypothetical protein